MLLPGAAVLRAYYTSIKERKSVIHIPFTELLIRGLIFSFILHCAAVCLIRVAGFTIEFNVLYTVLKGGNLSISNQKFETFFLNFCTYNLSLTILVFAATKGMKQWIQARNLDLNYNSLRNTNHWFQLFSARYLDIHNIQGERDETDIVLLDVLTSKDVIYSGFLIDYNYKPETDTLESLVLSNVRKRRHTASVADTMQVEAGPASPVPGDVFLIPSNNITNLNIYYLNIAGDISVEPAQLANGTTSANPQSAAN